MRNSSNQNFIKEVKTTNKVWNNELASQTDFAQGDCWSDIMDNCSEGDKVINGVGQLFIVLRAAFVDFGQGDLKNGLNTTVNLQPCKKDGTMHMGMNHVHNTDFGWGWNRD